MKITEITVHAERCFNHPFEQYSNLRPSITLTASIEPGEDTGEATKSLQSQAETLVEDHKQTMLKSLHELERMQQTTAELRRLGDEIQRAQSRLTDLRKENPQATFDLPETINPL